jgi:hypothetical protein
MSPRPVGVLTLIDFEHAGETVAERECKVEIRCIVGVDMRLTTGRHIWTGAREILFIVVTTTVGQHVSKYGSS